MTSEEKEFLISLLNQLTLKLADPEAVHTTTMVQSILKKLTADSKN